MREFIYASYLRITSEEFFDLAAERMSKAYEQARLEGIKSVCNELLRK